MKRKNDKFRKRNKYTKGEELAETAYGEIETQSERYKAARENVDKLQARAYNMSRDLAKIAAEMKESQNQIVAESLSYRDVKIQIAWAQSPVDVVATATCAANSG